MSESDDFRSLLLKAQHNRQLVCIYADVGDMGRFSVGYVSAVREEDFTLEEVDPEGQPDGISVGQLEDIFRVDIGSRYANQIQLMLEERGAIAADEPSGEELGIPPVNCLSSMLDIALASQVVVYFFLETGDDNDEIYGIPRRVHEEFVEVDVLTRDGEPDGTTCIPIELITKIRVDGRDERRVALLNKHRMHLYL